jgi:L-methionine (R)-S-oxide reductase
MTSIVEQLQGTTDANERLTILLQHFHCDSGSMHMVSTDGTSLQLTAHGPGMPEFVLDKIRTIPVGKGMAGLCVERNAPVDSCNIQTDTTGDVQAGAKSTNLQGSIVVPIRQTMDGPAVGTLGIATMKERTFTESEIQELIEYAMILA